MELTRAAVDALVQAQEPLSAENVTNFTTAFKGIAGEENAALLSQLLTAALAKVGAASVHRHASRTLWPTVPLTHLMTPRAAAQEDQSPVSRDGVILGPISSKDTRKVGDQVRRHSSACSKRDVPCDHVPTSELSSNCCAISSCCESRSRPWPSAGSPSQHHGLAACCRQSTSSSGTTRSCSTSPLNTRQWRWKQVAARRSQQQAQELQQRMLPHLNLHQVLLTLQQQALQQQQPQGMPRSWMPMQQQRRPGSWTGCWGPTAQQQQETAGQRRRPTNVQRSLSSLQPAPTRRRHAAAAQAS
jgi:hypothetical protein